MQKTIEELMILGERYGVSENALFVNAVNQYDVQRTVLEKMRESLNDPESMVTTKEYVKGRQNLCANPLVQLLPKHVDSMNKTLTVLLDIIQKCGSEKPEADELDEYRNG